MNANPSSHFMLGAVNCSTFNVDMLLKEIYQLLQDHSLQPRTINCLNAHIFNLAWNDYELSDNLNSSRIVAVDGMSVVWVARWLLGVQIKERCNMTDAFRRFMMEPSFPETQAVLIGGTEEQARLASNTINRSCKHMVVIDSLSGYLSDDAYVSYFQNCDSLPEFVFLGLGTPKTERVARLISEVNSTSIIWHIGGGTILFLSGYLNEAPSWMKSVGLQWLHRLILEPKRLWRRYLIGNPLFLYRVLKQKFTKI